MRRIHSISATSWDPSFSSRERQAALSALEQGQTLYFPSLAFPLSDAERRFLDPAILGRAKNVSYNPATSALGGTICQGKDADDLAAVLYRYADSALKLLQQLLPHYRPALIRQRTSMRPAEIAGRRSSWRKDDSRLHVDSFPSQPVQGRRILRVFCNVNPHGRARTWRLGESFPTVARWFWPRLAAPRWLHRQILSVFHVTKGLRTEYDHYMLQLHDAMKADVGYQQNVDQETIEFPAGSAWVCFTDQVSHAAMAGQHQFEQTFALPVEAMQDPQTAPLTVLEQLAGRRLIDRAGRRAA
jgi:hypothetical protein